MAYPSELWPILRDSMDLLQPFLQEFYIEWNGSDSTHWARTDHGDLRNQTQMALLPVISSSPATPTASNKD
jgi:hypothetical protein